MVNIFADSSFFLAYALKYPSTINFPGIVPQSHNVNKITAFPLRCVNINELNGPGSGVGNTTLFTVSLMPFFIGRHLKSLFFLQAFLRY